MGHLRTKKSQATYFAYVAAGGLMGGCRLCEKKPIKSFTHWKIVENPFPYDKIAATHHMIVPKRHVQERKLSKKEMLDFQHIKDTYLHKTYEFIIESTYRKKSIPDHLHLHLILAK